MRPRRSSRSVAREGQKTGKCTRPGRWPPLRRPSWTDAPSLAPRGTGASAPVHRRRPLCPPPHHEAAHYKARLACCGTFDEIQFGPARNACGSSSPPDPAAGRHRCERSNADGLCGPDPRHRRPSGRRPSATVCFAVGSSRSPAPGKVPTRAAVLHRCQRRAFYQVVDALGTALALSRTGYALSSSSARPPQHSAPPDRARVRHLDDPAMAGAAIGAAAWRHSASVGVA